MDSPRVRVERIEKECDGVWAEYGVTSWERTFLENIKTRSTLTPAQEDTLEKIGWKVFDARS